MKLNYIYGTAWKEEKTKECVLKALYAGYLAIDTANQRKHYFEEQVGEALQEFYKKSKSKRINIFLQTKFTGIAGQDHRKAYDSSASLTEQVKQSFKSSLEHLKTSYIDSFILHGPSNRENLTEQDFETWRAMEELYYQGSVKYLGFSNISLEQLEQLYQNVEVPPTFVQNRCFAQKLWDKDIRTFCFEKNISYQGFSLLTANKDFLDAEFKEVDGYSTPALKFSNLNNNIHPEVARIINSTNWTLQQIIFKFAQQVGIIPLVGSRDEKHLLSNLKINDVALDCTQLNLIENIAFLD